MGILNAIAGGLTGGAQAAGQLADEQIAQQNRIQLAQATADIQVRADQQMKDYSIGLAHQEQERAGQQFQSAMNPDNSVNNNALMAQGRGDIAAQMADIRAKGIHTVPWGGQLSDASGNILADNSPARNQAALLNAENRGRKQPSTEEQLTENLKNQDLVRRSLDGMIGPQRTTTDENGNTVAEPLSYAIHNLTHARALDNDNYKTEGLQRSVDYGQQAYQYYATQARQKFPQDANAQRAYIVAGLNGEADAKSWRNPGAASGTTAAPGAAPGTVVPSNNGVLNSNVSPVRSWTDKYSPADLEDIVSGKNIRNHTFTDAERKQASVALETSRNAPTVGNKLRKLGTTVQNFLGPRPGEENQP